jgi:transcriptional regulator with GAF, ATPase, and Fis domain
MMSTELLEKPSFRRPSGMKALVGKLLKPFSRKNTLPNELQREKAMKEFELETAYFQISSAMIAHKDLPVVLELVLRESLSSLRGHRVTIFFLDEKSGILKVQSSDVLKPLYRLADLAEEKEVARKAIMQGKSFFLQEPRDFLEFSPNRNRGWKVSSLLCIPLSSQRKPVGALSVVLIGEKRRFSPKDMKNLYFFGNLASLAMENAHLTEELHKAISSRKTFEQYLDNLLRRVQGILGTESWPNEEHLENLLPVQMTLEDRPFETHAGQKVAGMYRPLGPVREIGPNC